MVLRPYCGGDLPLLVALFYDSVHTVCARDYTPAELNAWADGAIDLAAWDGSLRAHHTLVAEEEGRLLGFADLDGDYLDRLYVRADAQRRGVGAALAEAMESRAREAGMPVIGTHASRTALPFFLGRGYRVLRAQQVPRGDQLLENFVMEMEL